MAEVFEGNGDTSSLELLAAAQKEGICIVRQAEAIPVVTTKEGTQFCTTGTDAVQFDPSSLKNLASCKIGFKITNASEEDLYFGIGRRFTEPGQDPLYPGDPFVGMVGTDDPLFAVGLNGNPSGPNALGQQQFMEHCPEGLIKSIDLARIPNASPLLDSDLVMVKYFCNGDNCKRTTLSPICELCPGNGTSNFTNIRYNFGLAAYGRRNAIGLLIPGTPEGEDAITYNVRVNLAFVEGAYGYVKSC